MRLPQHGLKPLAVVVAVGLLLPGCAAGGRGVTVPPGWDELEECDVMSVAAEDLAREGAPACDLAGSSLSFPSGMGMVTIPEVGEVFSRQVSGEPQILVVNWGVPGVGAASIDDGRVVDVWASTAEAEDLQRQQLSVEGVKQAG